MAAPDTSPDTPPTEGLSTGEVVARQAAGGPNLLPAPRGRPPWRQLVDELTHAVLRAEGVAQPGAFHLDNTAAFIHRLPTTGAGPRPLGPGPEETPTKG